MIRRPVCSYSATQRDPETGTELSDLEVIVCDDGTCWTLAENDAKQLMWAQQQVPPIPGTYAAQVLAGAVTAVP